jgi:hypothetical protein
MGRQTRKMNNINAQRRIRDKRFAFTPQSKPISKFAVLCDTIEFMVWLIALCVFLYGYLYAIYDIVTAINDNSFSEFFMASIKFFAMLLHIVFAANAINEMCARIAARRDQGQAPGPRY